MSEPKPGMAVVHRSGTVDVLERRKSADSPIAGWWLRYSGGLADYALASDAWRLLDEDALRLLFPDRGQQ